MYVYLKTHTDLTEKKKTFWPNNVSIGGRNLTKH